MFRFGSWPVENGTLGKEGMMGEREGRGKSSERGGRERGRSRSGSRSRSRLEGEGSDSRKDRGETQRGRRAEGAHLAFTPTALNSGAQRHAVPCEAFRRSMVAHAGLPSGPMIEPQRGSTMNQSQSKLVIICGTPLGFKFVLHSKAQCALRDTRPHFPQIFYSPPKYRHWCGLHWIREFAGCRPSFIRASARSPHQHSIFVRSQRIL